MTGFGKAQQVLAGKSISVEVKSVNHRYFDCNMHMPRSLNFLEEDAKKAVGAHISRGKIDLYIRLDFQETEGCEVVIDHPLLKSYLSAFETIGREYRLTGIKSVTDVARLPDVLTVQSVEMDEKELRDQILPVLEEALKHYDAMRITEGVRLAEDCLGKLDDIESAVSKIETLVPESLAAYRERLESKIREVVADRQIDEARILTEVAIFADKIAVDEEMVRLKSHIAQFRSLLTGAETPIGKKLDFLIQEMNREINTTGSKCSHIEITKIVVDVKAIIEKIREQIQNIE